jgi:hypothetical protein
MPACLVVPFLPVLSSNSVYPLHPPYTRFDGVRRVSGGPTHYGFLSIYRADEDICNTLKAVESAAGQTFLRRLGF